MMPTSLLLMMALPAQAHYLWQTTTDTETTVVFSENGLPGNKAILSAITNITTGRVSVGGAASPLVFKQRGAVLAAPVAAPIADIPAAIEASAPYGLHTIAGVPVFLTYYSSASRVADPAQWGDVQVSLQNYLSITLRDPFAFGPRQAAGAVETDPAQDDQCPRGLAAVDGDVCVLAVVRWQGQQGGFNFNISTFANGKALRTGRAKDGALVVRVPPNSDVFALVSLRIDAEPPLGFYATASTRVRRGPAPTSSGKTAFCEAVERNHGCCLDCGYSMGGPGECKASVKSQDTYCKSLEAPSQRGCCAFCGQAWSDTEKRCVLVSR
jgi:hypothetical protein